jgi:ankyrin repeat protein
LCSQINILANALLSKGADPSAPNLLKKETPLHFAVRRKFKDVCLKLLNKDALPYARDIDDVMPISIAIQDASDDIAAMLIKETPNHM